MACLLELNSNAVQLVVLPLFHTGGMNCYANPILHAGGRVLLMRDFEPGRALAVIGDRELGVTHFFGVPAPYQFMMQHPDFPSTDLSRLQMALAVHPVQKLFCRVGLIAVWLWCKAGA